MFCGRESSELQESQDSEFADGSHSSGYESYNGALRLMNWTKAKSAFVIGLCASFLTGASAVAFYNLWRPVEGIPKGWSVICGDVDQWSWANGKIHAHSTTRESILASTRVYSDFTLSAIACTTNREASFVFRLQDAGNGYLVIFAPCDRPRDEGKGFVWLLRKTAGEEAMLGAYSGRIFSSLGQTAKIAVTARGPWMKVYLNDVEILRRKDTNYAAGFIGLRIFGDPESPCDATFSRLTFH